MKAIGKVKELKNDYAVVVSERKSACSACHNCEAKGTCSAELVFGEQKQDVSVTAYNSVGAKIGDTVELESSTKYTLSLAIIIFILPFLLTAAIYYLIVNIFNSGISLPPILIVIFLVLFIIVSKIANRIIQSKKTITIVRVLEENQNLEAE